LPQGAAAFPQRMKMVFLIGDGMLAGDLALLIHQGNSFGQAAAAIASHLLQLGKTTKFFGPGLAVAVVGQSATQPAQAVLLHHPPPSPPDGQRRFHRRRPARPAVGPRRREPTAPLPPFVPPSAPTAPTEPRWACLAPATATISVGRRAS